VTVNSIDSAAEFVTNGVTTNYPFYFKFFAKEDLVVTYVDPDGASTTLTLGTHYNVNGVGSDDGGSVVTTTALAGPGQLVVAREMEAYQLTSIRNQGKFLAEIHEDVFDRLTMLIQQGLTTFTRALVRPFGLDFFNAVNRRISNVKDPIDEQDAATKSSVEEYVSSILATGQGPINNAANVIYAPPTGPATSVASKLTELSSDVDGTESAIASLSTLGQSLNANFLYQEITISGGAASLNVSAATNFGVLLASNITALSITGATAGKVCTVNLFVVQDAVGGKTIAFPPSVFTPFGESTLLSTRANSTSLIQLISRDAGATWLARKVRDYQTIREFVLPTLTGENSTFNDEGTAIAQWSASGGTLAATAGAVRFTKTAAAGTSGFMNQPVTLPASTSDYIMYAKIKCATTGGCVLWLTNSDSSRLAGVWLNATNVGVSSVGTVSLTGFNGGTRTGAEILTGFSTLDYLDIAMHFCVKNSSITVYSRQSTGTWNYLGRVAATSITATSIEIRSQGSAPAGFWVEYDFVTICRPNIAVIGDSIAEGKTLFSPNLSLNLTNFDSTWMRYAPIYPALRNNLVVNKGVGGNTSAQILARVSDVTSGGAKVVFLHASSNDITATSQSARTTNIQSTVNAFTTAGAQVVLVNGMYGALVGDNAQPALRNYMRTWWDTSSPGITGIAARIDIMTPLRTADYYMSASLTQSDGIHPNPAGYALVGGYISGGGLA